MRHGGFYIFFHLPTDGNHIEGFALRQITNHKFPYFNANN